MRLAILISGMAGCVLTTLATWGADVKSLEVHEVSLWIADPISGQWNARLSYPSAFPRMVESQRDKDRKPSFNIAPFSLLFFYGEPIDSLDLDLDLKSGRSLALWPAAEVKNRRLRWKELKLWSTPGEANMAFVEEDHWFNEARGMERALYVGKGARCDRFIGMDLELALPTPVTLDGGPDAYSIVNKMGFKLLDVVISAPGPSGRRIGWLDEIPANPSAPKNQTSASPPSETAPGLGGRGPQTIAAQILAAKKANAIQKSAASDKAASKAGNPSVTSGKPVSIKMNPAPSDPDSIRAAKEELKKRMAKAGLAPGEIALFFEQVSDKLFSANELLLAFRLGQADLDEQHPMEVFPEPKKIVRAAWVIVRGVDPGFKNEVAGLVQKLGDPSYKVRETAEKRLKELGAVAFPALKDAVKSPDPEVAYRAERILLAQNQAVPN